ncbi:GntR family transcriptional regulator [Afifella pfennigii]|uniref:GntR family transcriptional regulator n=1 Tax=Afifella pfennigii TaxID=209897 RepID=UPI00068D782B|nr:GntR family transcriptional regulator [Afifella pfennigii]
MQGLKKKTAETGGQRAAEVAYSAIRTGILNSRWKGGSHLREQELASAIGVSRTPVREALRRLNAEGLVTLVPNLGARVNDWKAHDLDEIFGLRALLESYAVELAASRIGEDEIAELKRLCEKMEGLIVEGQRIDHQRMSVYNDRFHGILYEASGNGRLRQLLKQVVEMPLVLRTFARYERRDLMRSMNHHREIVEALQAKDGAWAASVMRSHVRAGRAVFLDAATSS